MQANKMKKKVIEHINMYSVAKCILFFCIILLIIPMLPYSKFPGTTTDEFGYMYHTAKMIGWDWTELIRYYPYYGIGVGVMWYPLFILFSDSPTILYQSIVVINAFLLALSFGVSLSCANKLFPEWNKWIKLFSCFVLLLYPSNYFYARLALSETLLYLLFWVITFVVLKLLETRRIKWTILVGLFSGLMILVHLRTLGFVIAIGIMYIYWIISKKITWRHLFTLAFLLVIGLMILMYVQNGHFSEIGGANDANVQNAKISLSTMILEIISNIKNTVEGSTGHVLYYLVSGGVSFFFGIVFLIKQSLCEVKNIIKKENVSNPYISFYLFLLFAFLINFVAFYVKMHTVIGRYDVAMYGRYMENFMGPILLCGLYYITQEKKWIEYIYIYILSVVGFTPFVIRIMENSQTSIFAMDSAAGVGGYFFFFMNNDSVVFSILKMICITIISAIGYWIMGKVIDKSTLKNKVVLLGVCTLVLTGCYWGYLGYTSQMKFDVERTRLYEEYNDMKEKIDESKIDEIIFVQEIPNARNDIKYLQFLYRDLEIKVEKTEYVKKHDISSSAFLCEKNSDLSELETKGYVKYVYSKLILYVKQN